MFIKFFIFKFRLFLDYAIQCEIYIDYLIALFSHLNFDLQYNNQLVTKINNTFTVLTNNTNSTAQTALSEFTGYKWSDGNETATNLSALYTGWNSNSIGYSANNNFNVERVTIQDGQDIVHGDVYQIKFKIKSIKNNPRRGLKKRL